MILLTVGKMQSVTMTSVIAGPTVRFARQGERRHLCVKGSGTSNRESEMWWHRGRLCHEAAHIREREVWLCACLSRVEERLWNGTTCCLPWRGGTCSSIPIHPQSVAPPNLCLSSFQSNPLANERFCQLRRHQSQWLDHWHAAPILSTAKCA